MNWRVKHYLICLRNAIQTRSFSRCGGLAQCGGSVDENTSETGTSQYSLVQLNTTVLQYILSL